MWNALCPWKRGNGYFRTAWWPEVGEAKVSGAPANRGYVWLREDMMPLR